MSDSPGIVGKIRAIHDALDEAALAHAFGGALALAWCTQHARGTIDIDVNVFADASRAAEIIAALPPEIARDDHDVDACRRDGQVRLWWDKTPVDVFTNTTEFHEAAATRAIDHEFAGTVMPFLGCADLAVFKAFFNRAKDWVDIEEMLTAGTLDADLAVGVLVRYLGPDEERVGRLLALVRD